MRLKMISIGLPEAMSLLLKVKEFVDHAGLSLQLRHYKVLTVFTKT